ncbi:MAG: hypothetical protein Q4B21_02455, partial [Bacteroidia bacterium]|nr:hypothetical protein [Bacteroidia bacterium]
DYCTNLGIDYIMKHLRYILIVALVLTTSSIYAQNINDALRFSEQYSQGTARSMAMGNAFVALGGEIGAISINPASSGVYKFSEASITASLNGLNSTNTYLGNSATKNNTNIDLANIGVIGTFETGRRSSGLISWNLGIVFNRYQSFYRTDAAFGRTGNSSMLASIANNLNGINARDLDITDSYNPFFNANASWQSVLAWNASLLDTLPGTRDQYIAATENLKGTDISMAGEIDQEYFRNVKGSMSEIMLNFGGNFSNKFFFGVNVGIHSVLYRYSETYSESAVNSSQFQSGFRNFSNSYAQKTSGVGFNIKAGIIYLPTKSLRLGASISTPTWFYLHDKWAEDISCNFSDGYKQYIESPLGEYNYKINTPLRWNVGAAYTFADKGVLSVDYEQVNYGKARLKDDSYYYIEDFTQENALIEKTLKLSHIVRVGAEVNVSQGVSIRGGYQFYSNPYGTSYNPNHIVSAGLGYSTESGYFIDIAYQQKVNASAKTFSLYNDVYDGSNLVYSAPVGETKDKLFNILLTFGIRF